MQKTTTVDQANIDQLRKSHSKRLISASADLAICQRTARILVLLGKFAKIFSHLSNPSKEFGGRCGRPLAVG
jgi:hypothetical protein